MRSSTTRRENPPDGRYPSQRQSQPYPGGSSDPRYPPHAESHRQPQAHGDPRARQSQRMDPRMSRHMTSQRVPSHAPHHPEPHPTRQMTHQATAPSMRRSRESHSGRPRRGNNPNPGGGFFAGLFGRSRQHPSPPPQEHRAPSFSDQYSQDQGWQHDRHSPAREPPPEKKQGFFSKFKSIISFGSQRDRGPSLSSPRTDIDNAPPSMPLSPTSLPPQQHPDRDTPRSGLTAPTSEYGDMGGGTNPPSVTSQQPSQSFQQPGDTGQGERLGSNPQHVLDLHHRVLMQGAELQELQVYKHRLLTETRALEEARRKNLYLDFKLNLMVDMMVARVLDLEGYPGQPTPVKADTTVVFNKPPMKQFIASDVETVRRSPASGQGYSRRDPEPDLIKSFDEDDY